MSNLGQAYALGARRVDKFISSAKTAMAKTWDKIHRPMLGDWPAYASHGVAVIGGVLGGILLTPKSNERLNIASQTAAFTLESSRVVIEGAVRRYPEERYLIRSATADEPPCTPLSTTLHLYRQTPRMVVTLPISEAAHLLEVLNFHKTHSEESLYLFNVEEGRRRPRCRKGERIIYGL